MIHEGKIRELKETLVRKQDKNTFFEIDLARFRQELQKIFLSSIIINKRSAKFFDFIVFIKSNDLTFED